MNLTSEHIFEVFNRLKSYGHWMYFQEDGINRFNNSQREHNGKIFVPSITVDGHYCFTEQETKKVGIYKIKFETAPPQYGIENGTSSFMLVNKQDLDQEWIKIFEEIGIFFISAMQRQIALTWFVRMQENTAISITNDLLLLNK